MNKEVIIDIENIKDNDLISRQAVLNLINADWKYEGLEEPVSSLPPADSQELSGNLISNIDEYIKKSDLIAYITRKRDFINQNSDYYGKDGYHITDDICTDILGFIYSNADGIALEQQPCEDSQKRTGHWIKHYEYWECSECYTERAYGNEYCPDCGSHNGDISKPQRGR